MLRLKHFNGHLDDHQLELAEIMEKQKNIFVVYDVIDLENALKQADELESIEIKQNNRLVFFLRNYLEK